MVRKNEERFRLAARAARMYAYEWDVATDAAVLSGECEPVLGVKEGTQLTRLQFLSKLHPDDHKNVTAAVAGLSVEKPTFQISYRILHPDRGVIWVEANSLAVFDGAGRVSRIIGMVADITTRKQMESELAIANETLHLTMEAGKSMAWDWDVRSGRDCWFGDLQTMFGISTNTYAGHVDDFRRRVHPDDRELVWKAVKDAMQTRKPYVAEFRILWPDGTVRWVAAQGNFYYAPDGEPERMLGIAVDVTERKGAEEALRRKEIELAEAQRLAGVGSWQWDPETDTVLWSNELYRIVGRDLDLPAPSYRELPQFYTPESCQRLQQAVEAALRTGAPYELELELIRPDGATRWIIARGEPQRDSAGHVVRLRGTVHDITERRRAEMALRESEERFRLAALARRMYAYEWDRVSDVIVRSGEFTRILGLNHEPEETTCRQMLITVHPDDRAKVLAATDACTPENPICRVAYRVLRPDGPPVWLEKHGHALFDEEGRMVRMIGMVADITEEKHSEEALTSLSRRLIEAQEIERARIARDLHDDIGQRLALLSVTLSQVNRSFLDSANALRLDEIRRLVADIAASVRDMSHELHSSALRLLDVGAALQSLCRELSEKSKVEIDFVCTDVPENVPKDISLCLFRVLQEALHNAVKHSGVGRFEVELRGESTAIYLSIRDFGIGFDPDSATERGGLGLTSMRERLKLVHGDLSIDAKPRRGTTIRASVPLPLPSASAPAAG